jgi:hypothetical protein
MSERARKPFTDKEMRREMLALVSLAMEGATQLEMLDHLIELEQKDSGPSGPERLLFTAAGGLYRWIVGLCGPEGLAVLHARLRELEAEESGHAGA